MPEIKMCANEEMAIDILEFIKRNYEKHSDEAGVKKYIEALQMGIDALKAKEVKHGHWYGVNHYQNKASGQCSECGKHEILRTDKDSLGIWYIDMPKCPNCGAIMDGKINYL